jgi:hypothetical protein
MTYLKQSNVPRKGCWASYHNGHAPPLFNLRLALADAGGGAGERQTNIWCHMKRAIFEWTGLFASVLAIMGLVYWGISIISHVADFKLSFFQGSAARIDISTANGTIVLCDHLNNLEIIESTEKSIPYVPAPTKVYHFTLPGFRFYYLTFNGESPIWSVKFSLLIPIALMFALGGFCIWRYRLAIRVPTVTLANNGRKPAPF